MPALPPDPAEAERVRLGTIKGLYRFGEGAVDRSAVRRRQPLPGHPAVLRFGVAGDGRGPAAAGRRLGGRRRPVVGDLLQVAAGGCHLGRSGGTASIPASRPRVPFVTESLAGSGGPIVAVTDFMRSVPDQVSRWMPRRFTSLGTDGFGRSDTREVLRRFFEVDAAHVVVAVLPGLAAEGSVPARRWPRPSSATASTPGSADPWSG